MLYPSAKHRGGRPVDGGSAPVMTLIYRLYSRPRAITWYALYEPSFFEGHVPYSFLPS